MVINLSHGNGGTETSLIINDIFMQYFKNSYNKDMQDAAVLDVSANIAFTTDSFVVQPLFYKGGDIGYLSVCGTVNDLLTCGAVPKYLSAAFIVETGTDTETLKLIAKSMYEASVEAGVNIVTGDTKVIEGRGGVYINTSGVGIITVPPYNFKDVRPSDAIIVTGTMGDHHACILSHRMGIDNNITSDTAPLCDIAQGVRKSGMKIKGMRDITRGGLGTVLNEIASFTNLKARVTEAKLPVSDQVSGLCKILGLDPYYMSNEGKMLVVVDEADADNLVNVIKSCKYGENAAVIGYFTEGTGVENVTSLGTLRKLNPLSGESLPRIC